MGREGAELRDAGDLLVARRGPRRVRSGDRGEARRLVGAAAPSLSQEIEALGVSALASHERKLPDLDGRQLL